MDDGAAAPHLPEIEDEFFDITVDSGAVPMECDVMDTDAGGTMFGTMLDDGSAPAGFGGGDDNGADGTQAGGDRAQPFTFETEPDCGGGAAGSSEAA
eukprot:2681909-Pyramimonas_sp.AAC.1